MNIGIAKRYLTLIATLAAAVMVYTWYWHNAADKIREGVPAIIEAARDRGYAVTLSEPQISGYPYRIVVAFNLVELAPNSESLSSSDINQNWSIKLNDMVGYAQPWNLAHAIFEFNRSVTATWNQVKYIGTSETALMSISFVDDLPQRLSTDIAGLKVKVPDIGDVFSAHRTQLHLERQPGNRLENDSFRVSLTMEELAIPPNLLSIFAHLAPQVSQLRISGALQNREPFPTPTSETNAGNWLLGLSDLSVDWPPVEIVGSGELSLDGKRRPQGSVRMLTRGQEAIVDSLETAGILSARKAVAIKTALKLLRTSSGSSDPNDGLLPVTIEMQDGRLYLGPVKLTKIRPLW